MRLLLILTSLMLAPAAFAADGPPTPAFQPPPAPAPAFPPASQPAAVNINGQPQKNGDTLQGCLGAKAVQNQVTECTAAKDAAAKACRVSDIDAKIMAKKNVAKRDLSDSEQGFQGCQAVMTSASPELQGMVQDFIKDCNEKREAARKQCATNKFVLMGLNKEGTCAGYLNPPIKQVGEHLAAIEKLQSSVDNAEKEIVSLQGEETGASTTCTNTGGSSPQASTELKNTPKIETEDEKKARDELNARNMFLGVHTNENGDVEVVGPREAQRRAIETYWTNQGLDKDDPFVRAMAPREQTGYSPSTTVISGDVDRTVDVGRFAGPPAPGVAPSTAPAQTTAPATGPVAATAPAQAAPDQSTAVNSGSMNPNPAAQQAAAALAQQPAVQQAVATPAPPLNQQQPQLVPIAGIAPVEIPAAGTNAAAAGPTVTITNAEIPNALDIKPVKNADRKLAAVSPTAGSLKNAAAAPASSSNDSSIESAVAAVNRHNLATVNAASSSPTSGGGIFSKFKAWWSPGSTGSMFGSGGTEAEKAAAAKAANVDLRQFLPTETRVSGNSATSRSPGVHGPHTVLWNAVNGRYHSLQETLIKEK